MFRDNMVGDVTVRDKPSTLFLFVALAPWDRQLAQVTSPSHIVDAKSFYHVVRKGSAGSRKVRRSAVEMAIVADSLRQMSTASSDARRRTHQCRVGHDQRCAGERDQDWSLHSAAEASKDETAVRTTTSQTLTAIRCRADSQRVLPKREGRR